MNDIWDFGFTAVTEDELEVVREIHSKAEANADTADKLQDKIDNLYNTIIPLLNNLKRNPEKDYIHWPNRLQKVEEFEDHLMKIYQR